MTINVLHISQLLICQKIKTASHWSMLIWLYLCTREIIDVIPLKVLLFLLALHVYKDDYRVPVILVTFHLAQDIIISSQVVILSCLLWSDYIMYTINLLHMDSNSI